MIRLLHRVPREGSLEDLLEIVLTLQLDEGEGVGIEDKDLDEVPAALENLYLQQWCRSWCLLCKSRRS